MNTVGIIGLGNMGHGMAKNVSSAGFSVIAFDIDTNKANQLQSPKIKHAKNASEVGDIASIVIICLPNPEASKEVIFNQVASNTNVTTIIETSTLTPEIVTNFAKQLHQLGKRFISAPMVGGKNHASNGAIEFLVEGDEDVYEECAPIFKAMGKPRYMGAIPSATLAKLTFNLCRYANLAVAVEAYRLLKPYGANIDAIHEFMSAQSLDNFGQVWAEDMKAMMTQDIVFKPSQVPKKDLTLLIEMAEKHTVDFEIIKAIRNMYLSME